MGAGNTLELGAALTFTGKSWIKTGDGILKTDVSNNGVSRQGSNIQILGGTLDVLSAGFSGGAEQLTIKNGARLLTEQTNGFSTNGAMTIKIGDGGATIENGLTGAANYLRIQGVITLPEAKPVSPIP